MDEAESYRESKPDIEHEDEQPLQLPPYVMFPKLIICYF